MSFTYTTGIPAAGNNPSNDQPNMRDNTDSISSLISIDHVGFNDADGGKHLQVTIEGNNVPGAQAGDQSVLYTNTGTASSSPQLFWRNANRIFHFPIKAWGVGASGGGISTSQSFNVASIVRNSLGSYTVTLTTGATASVNYGVVFGSGLSAGLQTSINYSITSTTTFDVFIRKSDNTSTNLDAGFSFIVVQI